MKRFYLSRKERVIGGVCGGLATYFDVDPALVRIGMCALVLTPFPVAFFYILTWMIAPIEPIV